MDQLGTALGDQVRAVFLLQALHVGDTAQEHRAGPARMDLARARHRVLPDVVEQPGDVAMGSVFVVVGPVPGEDLVGLAAEQEVEFLLEEVADLLAELLTEIGHHPAAELEAPGRILGRPAGRLHDAIQGHHGANDDLPHGSALLPRTMLLSSQPPCRVPADAHVGTPQGMSSVTRLVALWASGQVRAQTSCQP